MSAAAWRWVWKQPAYLPDPRRITWMAGTSSTSSSRCPSASAGWWLRPVAQKDRIFTMPEPAGFYYSGASRVRQFGTAIQWPAFLSDPGRVRQISGASSGPPSAQALTEAVAWGRSTSPTFSSSRGWWRRQPAWKSRIYARLFLSGLGQARLLSTANQQQRQTTKPHLYLVLDDHPNGFTIHKLDIDLQVGSSSEEIPLNFPEPPALRIGPPTIGKFAQFAALGSHIIAICPCTKGLSKTEEGFRGATLIFDTKTSILSVSNILPRKLPFGYEAAIAVRNRLYVFESCMVINEGSNGLYFSGGLHCLAADPNGDKMHCAWQPLSDSSQFSWSWTDSPPKLPFDPKGITAYALNPCTGNILLSVSGLESSGTFSYGLGGKAQWTYLGNFVLPFKGPVHYDDELDAWVGLHFPSHQTKDTVGYICACPVFTSNELPQWKLCMQKLFMEDPYLRHVDAKLVYMGEGSKYCLVERLTPIGAGEMNYLIRLTTFIVIYGEDRVLRTIPHSHARFYKAPSYVFKFDLQAFWM
ncbi:uncharacterized protein LOC100839886 isoform X2 [Brachypodium distachyon]|uniref:uncharacterized protein LOC100839886 isoform X2 n=1 Tax=Brachypodium distachyon TaxID=15368 RepID=UPI0001C76C35|nr:uncharacterized protein LOC100839886 isoform X2 [Brachypodium distachyon]|eukprot:XP_010229122.1 uncharacterized protein LOC100839886 isoform X2 [Brachypodium distachyon]